MTINTTRIAVTGLGLIAALILCGQAKAQPLPPMEVGVNNSIITITGQSPASADEARAQGDRLVATRYASDQFENITDDATVKIRHKKSGLVCRLPGLLMAIPASEIEALSSARKFTCVNFANRFQNDLSITANTYSLSVDRALAAVVAEARAEIKGLNYTSPRVIWDDDFDLGISNAQPLIAGLSTGNKPDSQYEFISVIIVRGWIISNVIRGHFDQKDQVDFVGNEMMRRARRDVRADN